MSRRYQLKAAAPAARALNYEGLLNEQQIAVVEAGGGPILVIAGAGSGKTRTLTWRVARLVHAGVPPESVLLLTFTNKAAREMLRRVEEVAHVDARRIEGAPSTTSPTRSCASTVSTSGTGAATRSWTGRTRAT